MTFSPQRTRKGRKRTEISSPVLQAAMTTMYLLIPVSVVIRKVGMEGAEAGGGGGPHPDTTVEPSAKSIIRLFKHLGIEQQFDSFMINVEQFMRLSDLVSLDNRQIESICAVNSRGEVHSRTYISGTG